MKLIFKHILRSIRSSPVQPLLILLTVSLSMAIATVTLGVSFKQNRVSDEISAKEEAVGDLLITTRADSAARILFVEDVESRVGDKGNVTGEFSLVGFLDGIDGQAETKRNPVSVSATDLADMDRFYQFEYVSYGRFSEDTLSSSAIISESFAKQMRLSVGDELSLRLVGEDMTYTVQAIAKDGGILYERDMLISISGLTELISRKIPSVAILGDSFAPCSRLMVTANNTSSAEELLELLSEDQTLSDKSVVLTDDGGRADFWNFVRSIALYTLTILIFLLAAFLIGTSLTLLHKKRKEELSLFLLAGASPSQTNAWRCIECALYTVVGIGMGALLALPLTKAAGWLYEWDLSLHPIPLSVGAAMTLLLMAICTARHIYGANKTKKNKAASHVFFKYGSILILAVICIAALIVPIEYRYVFCFSAILVLVWIVFQAAPALLRRTAAWIEKQQEKKEAPNAAMLLGSKSIRRRFTYSFSCGLLAVMISILSVITVCQQALTKQVDLWENGFYADTVAYGLTEHAEEKLRADDGVNTTLRVYYNTSAQLPGGSTAVAISTEGDPSPFVDPKMLPHAMPEGNQVILSGGLAALAGVDVGDSICLTVGGVEGIFVVSEILQISNNTFYFDSDALGIRKNIVFVQFKDGADGYAIMERIAPIMESDGALISDLESIFGHISTSLEGHTSFLLCAMIAAFLLGSVGIVNLLIGLNGERKAERTRLRECGMENAAMRKLTAYELLFLFASAAVVALPFGALLSIVVDLSLRSFGILLFTV